MIRVPLLGLTPAVLYQYGPSTRSGIRHTKGALVGTVNFMASVQPLRAHELQILPEGDRAFESYMCYTYTDVATADQYADRSADEVVWKGNRYKITRAPLWNQLTGHYEFAMTRIQEGTA